jgi:hypothetical protein
MPRGPGCGLPVSSFNTVPEHEITANPQLNDRGHGGSCAFATGGAFARRRRYQQAAPGYPTPVPAKQQNRARGGNDSSVTIAVPFAQPQPCARNVRPETTEAQLEFLVIVFIITLRPYVTALTIFFQRHMVLIEGLPF